MLKRIAALTIVVMAMSAGSVFAQQCLHGADESAEQAQRRRDALTATRTLGTLQASHAGRSGGQYARHEELLATAYAQATMKQSTNDTVRRMLLNPTDDVLPGWTLTLDVSSTGYWFMIKDKTDPCGFAYVSTQAGLIYTAQPLR
jgi:hypothetical protein